MAYNTVTYHPKLAQVAYSINDGKIQLWDAESGTPIKTLVGHQGAVSCIQFSRDGKFLASGSDDKTIKLWDLETGECLKTFHAAETVNDLAFNPAGTELFSCGYIGEIMKWDIASGHCVFQKDDANHSVAIHPSNHRFASASLDNSVKIWSTKTGEKEAVLSGHMDWVQSVAYPSDGMQLASGSSDATIKIWDVKNKKCLRTIHYLPLDNYAMVDEEKQVIVYSTKDAKAYFRGLD